jgi:hypothetical protein
VVHPPVPDFLVILNLKKFEKDKFGAKLLKANRIAVIQDTKPSRSTYKVREPYLYSVPIAYTLTRPLPKTGLAIFKNICFQL